jgi:nucleoside-diphosphate-sugar epimerase
MPRRVPDTSRIRNLIGWQPTRDLDRILKDVFDFYARTDN